MPLFDYKKIERRLGIRFKRKSMLKTALVHASYRPAGKKGRPIENNETLEFLGDAVLELLTREYLYQKYPAAPEGELSELKKLYTNTETLHKIGKKLGLGQMLLMDRGEVSTGGRHRPSNIAGCLEALLGALYLDRGLDYTRRFVDHEILYRMHGRFEDHKSRLNQWAQRHHQAVLYRVFKEKGPAHQKTFYIDLYVAGKRVARGVGGTKRQAQRLAAKVYLKNIPRE